MKKIGIIFIGFAVLVAGVLLYLFLRNRKQSSDWTAKLETALGGLNEIQKDSVQHIIKSWNRFGDGDENKLAYIFATAWHESSLESKEERRCASHQLCYQYQENYWYDGYKGRGLVQITHENNYRKLGNALGINLVDNPQRVLEVGIASDILVYGMMNGTFTGRKLSDYINQDIVDFVGARWIVNGKDDNAADVAATAESIKNA